jgi:hypothetical protein
VVCRDRRDELRQPALPAPEDTSDVADPETVDEVLEKLNEKLRWR